MGKGHKDKGAVRRTPQSQSGIQAPVPGGSASDLERAADSVSSWMLNKRYPFFLPLEVAEPGEEYRVMSFPLSQGTQLMEDYVGRLRAEGFDIGPGNAAWGYRMPLPGKEEATRTLVIYRRQ